MTSTTVLFLWSFPSFLASTLPLPSSSLQSIFLDWFYKMIPAPFSHSRERTLYHEFYLMLLLTRSACHKPILLHNLILDQRANLASITETRDGVVFFQKCTHLSFIGFLINFLDNHKCKTLQKGTWG